MLEPEPHITRVNSGEVYISVVITCYLEGELIFDAVESVLKQSIRASEIIVVNDASTHQITNEVCQKLEKSDQVQVIWREENGGPSASRETGFKSAKGEILVPLDADDILPETALEHIQTAFLAHPDAGFIYGNYIRQDQPNREVLVNPGDISLKRMLSSKPLSLSSQWALIGTTPLRRSLWEAVGGCDPELGTADLHDLEFWIRAIALPCQCYYIPEVIYTWRKYLGTNSRRVTPMSWYRIAKKHFDVYLAVDLEFRAYELLLLGSKFCQNQREIQQYSQALKHSILRGRFKLSTIAALLIPATLLQVLTQQVGKRR